MYSGAHTDIQNLQRELMGNPLPVDTEADRNITVYSRIESFTVCFAFIKYDVMFLHRFFFVNGSVAFSALKE